MGFNPKKDLPLGIFLMPDFFHSNRPKTSPSPCGLTPATIWLPPCSPSRPWRVGLEKKTWKGWEKDDIAIELSIENPGFPKPRKHHGDRYNDCQKFLLVYFWCSFTPSKWILVDARALDEHNPPWKPKTVEKKHEQTWANCFKFGDNYLLNHLICLQSWTKFQVTPANGATATLAARDLWLTYVSWMYRVLLGSWEGQVVSLIFGGAFFWGGYQQIGSHTTAKFRRGTKTLKHIKTLNPRVLDSTQQKNLLNLFQLGPGANSFPDDPFGQDTYRCFFFRSYFLDDFFSEARGIPWNEAWIGVFMVRKTFSSWDFLGVY